MGRPPGRPRPSWIRSASPVEIAQRAFFEFARSTAWTPPWAIHRTSATRTLRDQRGRGDSRQRLLRAAFGLLRQLPDDWLGRRCPENC